MHYRKNSPIIQRATERGKKGKRVKRKTEHLRDQRMLLTHTHTHLTGEDDYVIGVQWARSLGERTGESTWRESAKEREIALK